jgi:hypothetical protein
MRQLQQPCGVKVIQFGFNVHGVFAFVESPRRR